MQSILIAILFPAFIFGQVQPRIPMPSPEPPLASNAGLKLPESVKAAAGDLVIIRAESTCKRATWILPPAISADPNEGGLKLTLVAPAVGQYTLFCVVSPAADQIVVAKVLLEVGGPAPPPKPPIPDPVDSFVADLKRLYDAEPNSPKKEIASALAGVYRLAAKGALDKSLATVADLMDLIADAAGQVAADKLPTVRARVIAELKKLGDADATLSDALRASIADVYGRAAKALEEAAK